MSGDLDSMARDPAVAAWVDRLVDEAASIRLPELFASEPPGAVHAKVDRHGVTTVVLPTSAMSEEQLVKLMRYRLAQYLVVDFVDASMIYQARLEHEPTTGLSPDDIHVIAGSAATGDVLCYAVLKAPPDAPSGTMLRDRDRPLFAVEKVHGWGVFSRLRIIPDLPANKIRELGRFVKNQRLHALDELGARAPVEVGVALFRAVSGPLRLEIEAIIGDLEEGVAKQNLDFFHVPMVVLHGTVPYEAEASYFYPRYQFCTVYPFAAVASDISRDMIARLDAIDAALDQPAKAGLLALFRLKRELAEPRSTALPPDGLPPLADADVPQQGVPMASRRVMLDLANNLRMTDLFGGLSVAEATILGTFMERVTADAGDIIVHEGELGDDMYLIESGTAHVQIGRNQGNSMTVATLGPGDFFGEVALLTGSSRIADVVATEPMTLLRLGREAYDQYLTRAAEVEQHVTRAAMTRTHETSRRMRSGT